MCKSQSTDDKPFLIGAWSGYVTDKNFLGSNHITGMAEHNVVKFCAQVGCVNSSNRMSYHTQKGRGYGHVTVLQFYRLSLGNASPGFVSDSCATCYIWR